MDRLASIEVILHNLKEAQMFLLANPGKDRTLKEMELITHGLIKLLTTGLYTKAIEKWNARNLANRKK